MSDTTIVLNPIDPAWNLPTAPTRGCPVSGATFARLLTAAREGGWPAVFTVWAEGQTIIEAGGTTRPARKSTLGEFLRERRPDLRSILDDAANQKRDRLLTQLEDEAERIALGPGDVTQDFDKSGNLTRTRVDKRTKLFAILQLLKAHDRDRYGDHRRVDVGGTIDHNHSAGLNTVPGITISPDSIHKLPEMRARALLDLLSEVMEIERAERNGNRGTDAGTMRSPQLPGAVADGEAEGRHPVDPG